MARVVAVLASSRLAGDERDTGARVRLATLDVPGEVRVDAESGGGAERGPGSRATTAMFTRGGRREFVSLRCAPSKPGSSARRVRWKEASSTR
jgi:hypothetical protein